MDPQPRAIELEVEIAAAQEEVWAALTEADGLVGWYVAQASVTPGEGGRIWASWGTEMEGAARIEVWEPPDRLRQRAPEDAPAAEQLVVEFTLSTRGNRTVLRLVHSGFGKDTWEDEYDSLATGWPLFLAVLRYYLEQRRGSLTRTFARFLRLEASGVQVWSALVAPGLPLGDESRLHVVPGKVLAVTVPALEGAVLALFVEQVRGQAMATLMLFTYDLDPDRAEEAWNRLEGGFAATIEEAGRATV